MRSLDRKNVAALRKLVDEAAAGRFAQLAKILADAGYRRGIFAATLTELTTGLAIATRTWKDWLTRGCPGRTKQGYDVFAIARWRNEHLLKQINQPLSVDADDALKRVKTEREKLKLARERGEVIEVDQIERVWRRYFAAAKSIILGIPDRILVVLPDGLRADLQAVLRDTADEVLSQLERAALEIEVEDDVAETKNE